MSPDMIIVVFAAVLLVGALVIIALAPRVMRGRHLTGPFAGQEVLFARLANTLVALSCVVVILTHL
jgi:hypothetical protein